MSGKGRIALLVIIMVIVLAAVGAVSLFMLYRAAIQEQKERLSEIARSMALHYVEAAAIEGITADILANGVDDEQLHNLVELHTHYLTRTDTGEIVVGRRRGDTMAFLLREAWHEEGAPRTLAFDSPFARPMYNALSGLSGTMIGTDYRGKEVLAAYEPVPALGLGVVAKIDLAEVRAPFVRAGTTAGIVALVLAIVSSIAFVRVSAPIIRQIDESEERFRMLVESAPEAIFVQTDKRFTYVNPAAVRLYGASSADELLGKPVMERFHPDYHKVITARIKGLNANHIPQAGIDQRHIRLDGTLVDVSVSAVPLRYEGKDGALVFVRDITERKRAEAIHSVRTRLLEFSVSHPLDEVLTATLDEIEALTDSSIGFYHFLQPDQETLSLQNWSTNTLLRMCTAEGKGSHYTVSQAGVWVDCVHERRPVIHNDYASLPHRKGLPDGHAPVEREVVVPIFRADQIVAIIGVGNKPDNYNESDIEIVSKLGDLSWDIVERKRAEAALRAFTQRQEAILEAVPDIIMEVDSNKIYTWANRAGYDFFGDDVIGKEAEFYFDGEQDTYTAVQPLFEGNEDLFYVESWQRRKDGARRLLGWWCRALKDENGNVTGALSSARDMTDWRTAEEEVKKSATFLDSIIDQSPVPTWISDETGTLRRINKACCDLLRITPDEVIGKYSVLNDNIVKEQGHLRKVMAVFRKGETARFELNYDTTHVKGLDLKNQASVFLDVTIFPVRDPGGKIRSAVIQHKDITEKKQAERALQESEEKYRTVADYTYDWEYWVAPDGRAIYVSPACERITGYRAEEFMADPGLLTAIAHPDDLEKLAQHEAQIIDKEAEKLDFRIITRGGEERWIAHVCQEVYGSDGSSLGRRASNRDITARKRDEGEIRKLNDELEQRVIDRTAQLQAANKELEAFSYSVSHDLRTPLRAIDGFTRVLVEEYDKKLDEEGVRLTGVIRDNTLRMGKLIDDLLAFSRVGRAELHAAEVNTDLLVRSVFVELTTEEDRARIDFSVGHLPAAFGDAAMLRQVWTNLVSNAVKFSSKKERSVIEVSGRSDGSDTIYSIKDNGAGFDMKYSDKLFGVFHRLHGEKEFPGTGVGLAIVQRVVVRHGGRVWAEGEVGAGAEFSFSLPKQGGEL
jgi:PAS domain S-box-containing protein